MMRTTPRYDLATTPIDDRRLLKVYRRADRFGRGVCCSVDIDGREALRFDLFPDAAHMHMGDEDDQPRHYYPTGLGVWQYIELALADLAGLCDGVTAAHVAWARQALVDVAMSTLNNPPPVQYHPAP